MTARLYLAPDAYGDMTIWRGIEAHEPYCEIAAKRLTQDTLFGGVA